MTEAVIAYAIDLELDVRQLVCPLPILRAKKSLAQMQPGQLLKIWATDRKTPEDFADFCQKTGNELLTSQQDGDVFQFVIRRRAPHPVTPAP